MTVSTNIPAKRKRKVPAYLIYETLNGKPLYYKGYKEVIRGQVGKEQSKIVSCLLANLPLTL